MVVRTGWKMEVVRKSPYEHLKEYLVENGINEFEIVFKKKLYDNRDNNEIDVIYLLRTNREFILARIITYINEIDVHACSMTIWSMDTLLAKQIARRVLQQQVKLDEILKERDEYD